MPTVTPTVKQIMIEINNECRKNKIPISSISREVWIIIQKVLRSHLYME